MIISDQDEFECEHCGMSVTDMSACTFPFCDRYDVRSVIGDNQEFILDRYEDVMDEVDDYKDED